MSDIALVLLDYINEIVDPSGKLAAKGYSNFIKAHGVYNALQRQIDLTDQSELVVAVSLGFLPDYTDLPLNSPIFGKAAKFGILQQGTWSTAYPDAIALPTSTVRLNKNRVSAFTGTMLDQLLRNQGIQTVRLAGIATDLAVEATARAAHDLDYSVEILSQCSAAATMEDHQRALDSLSKFAVIM